MSDDQKQAGAAQPRARNQDVLPEILGKQLRAAYGELLSSPVPDVFNDLVQKLRQQETSGETAKRPAPRKESDR